MYVCIRIFIFIKYHTMYNMVHLTRPEGAVGGHHTAPGDQLHVEASTFVSDTDWRINLMSMF